MPFRSWCPLFVCLILAACATKKTDIPTSLRDQLSSIRVVSVIEQPGIVRRRSITTYGPSIALNGALYAFPPALVGGAVISSIDFIRYHNEKTRTESHATKFNHLSEAFDFRQEFDDSVKDSMKALSWINSTYESRPDEYTKSQLKETLKEMQEDGLLVLRSAYWLTPNLESVEVYTDVKMYRRPENKRSPSLRPEFETRLKYQSPMVIPRARLLDADQIEAKRLSIVKYHDEQLEKSYSMERAKYWRKKKAEQLRKLETKGLKIVAKEYTAHQGGALWLANDASLLLSTLEHGIREQGRLLELALSTPAESVGDRAARVGIPSIYTVSAGPLSRNETKVSTVQLNGWLLKETELSAYYLTEYGVIVSIAKGDVLRPICGVCR